MGRENVDLVDMMAAAAVEEALNTASPLRPRRGRPMVQSIQFIHARIKRSIGGYYQPHYSGR
jgi:hypothetical protein